MPTREELLTQRQYAAHRGVHVDTVRNYLKRGYFTAYVVPGVRGHCVDPVEADAALDALPRTLIRASNGTLGPDAIVRHLPTGGEQ